MDLFTLCGKIAVNDKEANASIDNVTRKAESSESKISQTFSKVGKAIVTAFAVDKVIEFGKTVVENTAKINALDSQFTQTFKDKANDAMVLINNQSKEQGINVDRLKGSWSSFFGTFRGNGADVNQSLDLTKKYMELAGDGAAYYDKSLDDVVGRMKSLIMGNFEAGDAIGININATKMDIKAKEKYKKKWQDLNDTEKEFLLLDTVGKIYESNGAMGQGARESNNYENVLGNLKATWERFLSVIGQPILEGVVIVMQQLTGVIQGLTTNFGSLYSVFIKNPIVQSVLQPFEILMSKLQEGISFTGAFQEAFTNIIPEHALFMLTDFIGAFEFGIKGLIAFLQGDIDKARDMFYTIFPDDIENMIQVDKILDIINNLKERALNIFHNLKGAITLAMNIIGVAFELIGRVWSDIGPTIVSVTLSIIDIMTSLGNTVDEAIGSAIDKFNEFVEKVKNSTEVIKSLGIALGVLTAGILAYNGATITATIVTKAKNVIDTIYIASLYAQDIATKILTVSTGILNTVMGFAGSTIGIVTFIIAGIATAVYLIYENWDSISEWFSEKWEAVKKIFSSFFNWVKGVFYQHWNSVISDLSESWEWIKEVLSNFLTWVKDMFIQHWNGVISDVSGAWDNIKNIFSTSVDAIGSFFSTAWSTICNFFISAWQVVIWPFQMIWEIIKAIILSAFSIIEAIVGVATQIIQQLWQYLWDFLWQYIGPIWEGIKSIIQVSLDFITNLINIIGTYISETWTTIWSNITSISNSIWSVITSIWNSIWNTISSILNIIWGIITSIWNSIYNTISSILNIIWGVITSIWNSIYNTISKVLNIIWNTITSIWNSVYNTISSIIHSIWSIITSVWNTIYNTINSILHSIWNVITSIWNTILNTISSVIHAIWNIITSIWNSICNTISSVMNRISSTISGIWNSICSTISSIISSISSHISSAWNSICSITSSIWNNIKHAIWTPIQGVQELLSGFVDKVKGWFSNLFPHIKLPHFKIDGEFSLNPPSIPHLGVDWYADGGIMTKPTMFGFNPLTGNAMVGGEAGAEAILPIEKLNTMIQNSVASVMDNVIKSISIEELGNVITTSFKELNIGQQPVVVMLDGKVLASTIDSIQGNNLNMEGRLVGI